MGSTKRYLGKGEFIVDLGRITTIEEARAAVRYAESSTNSRIIKTLIYSLQADIDEKTGEKKLSGRIEDIEYRWEVKK